MAAQTEPPALDSGTFSEIYRRQETVFGTGNVHCYLACIPTYATGLLSFSYATAELADPQNDIVPAKARRFADAHGLQYYNDEIHKAAFVLPPYVIRRGQNTGNTADDHNTFPANSCGAIRRWFLRFLVDNGHA